jgi:hypothetical protein
MKSTTKKCSKCNEVKHVSNFDKKLSCSSGIRSECKDCRRLYRIDNKEKIKQQQKLHYNKNKIYILDQNKKYRLIHSEEMKKYQKTYRKLNKPILSEYYKKYLNDNETVKIGQRFRSRIKKAIKEQCGKKAYRSIELLGCSIEEARTYLESQFKPGMSWDNHGE